MINPKRRIWQASEIWKGFDFSMPFSAFLKNHFKQNKKYGKRDRTEIAVVLYSFLRTGYNSNHLGFEKAAKLGLLLSDSPPEELLKEYDLSENWKSFDLIERIAWCNQEFKIDFYNNFFKKSFELSKGINLSEFVHKVSKQSPVFIRVLRNRKEIISALKQGAFEYEEIDEYSIKLEADAKLHFLPKKLSTDFYIQDLASQNTIGFIDLEYREKWWDACCGAGGKSLLIKSIRPEIDLMASDIRKSILTNYNSRLKQHKYTPKAQLVDLSKCSMSINEVFDGIVIDAPCTGSGTWGRSPEGIQRIQEAALRNYSTKQKAICKNAVKNLSHSGKLIYITCSIFKAENENITQYLVDDLKLKLIRQSIIHSSNHNSDYLFAAQFINEK